LITGHGVIADDDIARLEAHGFGIDRVEVLDGTEDQLMAALRAKRGYICAGHERVTEAVIGAAGELEVISFPGSGFKEFVPGWELATARGVAVCAAIGANAPSVADYTILLMLGMLRGLPGAQPGVSRTWPARECAGLSLGIIGLGHSGLAVAQRASGLGMKVLAAVRQPPAAVPPYVDVVPLDDLLTQSDVVSVHVSRANGKGVLQAPHLARMRDGTLIINVAFPDAVDWDALRRELVDGRLRAAFDAPPAGDYADLPQQTFLASTSQTAYNTVDSNQRVSKMACDALLAVLSTGNHESVVNPEFAQHRR